MTTRHEFLAMLHGQLQPRGYLEIGVWDGESLKLAKCPAIGVDPDPHLRYHLPSSHVYSMTSDEFFAPLGLVIHLAKIMPGIDLAFIDGMHLFEYALRDFLNIEQYSNPRTVVVFDDVLPRNQHEAAREQCPGDWTGDVWKVPGILQMYRPDLTILLVDTEPTGTCVVFNLSQENLGPELYETVMTLGLEQWNDVPVEILNREGAVSPEEALKLIAAHQLTLETQEQT